jgi:hypothetical protein
LHETLPAAKELYPSRPRQHRYNLGIMRQFHIGGHFGCTNRVLVAEVVAPLLFKVIGE